MNMPPGPILSSLTEKTDTDNGLYLGVPVLALNESQSVSLTVDSAIDASKIRPLDSDKLDSMRKPRSAFYDKIEAMNDADLVKLVHNTFVMCHVGGDADARWKVDALEWECCSRRERPELYDQGYDSACNVDLTKRV